MYISCNGNVSAACHREVNIKGLQLTAIFYQTKRSKNIIVFKLRCTQVSLRMFFFLGMAFHRNHLIGRLLAKGVYKCDTGSLPSNDCNIFI